MRMIPFKKRSAPSGSCRSESTNKAFLLRIDFVNKKRTNRNQHFNRRLPPKLLYPSNKAADLEQRRRNQQRSLKAWSWVPANPWLLLSIHSRKNRFWIGLYSAIHPTAASTTLRRSHVLSLSDNRFSFSCSETLKLPRSSPESVIWTKRSHTVFPRICFWGAGAGCCVAHRLSLARIRYRKKKQGARSLTTAS